MADLIQVSILGSMPSGEVWSINPCWRLNGAPVGVTYADLNAIAIAIDAIAVPLPLTGLMSSGTLVTGCRVAARDVDGNLEAQAEHTRVAPAQGNGPDPHPFQTSVVLSLRTPNTGGSGRGRLYWPATGAGISSVTLRMDNGTIGGILTAFNDYLQDIEAAINGTLSDAILAVWSRQLQATFGVNRLILGDVLDTQRRRRDTVPESYISTVYA